MTTKPDRAEGKRRLLVLAEFLEKLPPNRFNFTTWVGKSWGGAQDLSCGTTACGFGWAPTALPELGLELRRGTLNSGFVCLKSDPEDVRYDGFEASVLTAGKVFALERREVISLFMPICDNNCTDGDDDEPCGESDCATCEEWRDSSGVLPDWASAKELSNHIRNFVKNWVDE